MTEDEVIELLRFYGFTQRSVFVWNTHNRGYPYVFVGVYRCIINLTNSLEISEDYEHIDLKWITEAIEDVLNTPESN